MFEISVNGSAHKVDVPAEMPLLWVLRDVLGLTGTKFGCGMGQCGACTVHIGGEAQRSCTVPVAEVGTSAVVTIEGLGKDGLHPVQAAWIEADVPQCGYCQPGMIMAAVDLLRRTPQATDEDIDAGLSNICRCGTYPRLRQAIRRAAQKGAA